MAAGPGRVSEASVWNVGFYDGEQVVWPDAASPAGIMMQLLQRGLEAKGIPSVRREIQLKDITTRASGLPSLSAFLTNSMSPALPVASVEGAAPAVDPAVTELLVDCYETNPWQKIQSRPAEWAGHGPSRELRRLGGARSGRTRGSRPAAAFSGQP